MSYDLALTLEVTEAQTATELEEVTVYRGDTPTIEFTFTNGSSTTFYDLTDATVSLAIKKDPSNELENPRFDKACTNDPDPTTGKCSVALDSSNTNLTGAFYAELQAEFTSGIIRTLGRFTLIFTQDIVA